MKTLSLALAVLPLMACAHAGTWAWRRADGSVDSTQLLDDVDACETYRRIADQRGALTQFAARPYGEWGNSSFEYCMGQKKWTLTYLTADARPR